MVVVDIVGGLILLVFAVLDFLRGAIRVIGGLVALIVAVICTYLFYESLGQFLAEKWVLDIQVSYFNLSLANPLGGVLLFLGTYLPGLFLFPYILRRLFKKLKKVEEMALEAADQAEEEPKKPQKAPVAKGKKAPPSPTPSPAPKGGEDDEIEEIAEEIQIGLMERLAGGILGAVKGTIIVSMLLFLIHLLPTPDFVLDSLRGSFFGKVYSHYITAPLERRSPEFKILNNMGYIIKIGQEIQEKPEGLTELRDHPSIKELESLKPVQDLIKDKEFIDWAREHPMEALKDARVKKVLEDPHVKEKLAEVDFRKLRDALRKGK